MISKDRLNAGSGGALVAFVALVAASTTTAGACSLAWNDYDPRVIAGSGTGSGVGATSSNAGSGSADSSSGAGGTGTGSAGGSNSGSGSGSAASSGGSCSTSPGASLVINPGFENGIVAWGFQTASVGASYSIDSGAGIGGSNAVKITNGGPSQFGAQVQQVPIDGLAKKLVKGDVYLFSSQLRGENGGEHAIVLFQSAAGATRECGTLTQGVSTEFARFGCRFRVPNEWDGQELALNLRSGGDMQTAFFDDVYFDVAPPGGLYNGDFDDDFVGWSYFETAPQMNVASIGLDVGYDGAGCKDGKSVRITHVDQNTNACGISQAPVMPLADGASYTLSLWARGDVGGEQMVVGVKDAAKNWVTLTSSGATLTTGWSKHELKLGPIAAPLTDVMPLIAILNKSPEATLFVDGVSWAIQ